MNISNYINLAGRTSIEELIKIISKVELFITGDSGPMHIAASSPMAVNREEIDGSLVSKEREIFLEQAKKEGKPEDIATKIVEGRVNKFFQENVLMEQSFVKDPEKTVGDIVTETIAKLGENIIINRYVRFQLGEKSSTQPDSQSSE